MTMHCTVCGEMKGLKRREETCPDCEAWGQRVGMQVWARLARSRRARREALRAAAVVDAVWAGEAA